MQRIQEVRGIAVGFFFGALAGKSTNPIRQFSAIYVGNGGPMIRGLIPVVHELDSWTIGKRDRVVARANGGQACVALERPSVILEGRWYYGCFRFAK